MMNTEGPDIDATGTANTNTEVAVPDFVTVLPV
jgi:hypothetical protein